MTIQERIEVAREALEEAATGDKHNFGHLVNAVGQLLDVVEQLAGDTAALPAECRQQTCTYYTHYLVYYDPALNGGKLDHIPYHAAEERCSEAQKRVTDWLDQHMNDGGHTPVPEGLERQATYWENRVCA